MQARLQAAVRGQDAAGLLAHRLAASYTERDALACTPWTSLYLAQALQQVGSAETAQRVARHGAAWVERVARESLPPEFRNSFLHRNPVNRELLALAQRLAAA